MKYIFIGKIITTHGIKGELKIRSNFKYKEKVFKVNNFLYFGKDKIPFKILSYRVHQNYDMLTFETLDDISKVIKYKQESVYFDREKLIIENDYLDEDLIGLSAIYKEELGFVTNIVDAGNGNLLFVVDNRFYVPKNDNFIEKVDLENKKIYFKDIEGLILWK